MEIELNCGNGKPLVGIGDVAADYGYRICAKARKWILPVRMDLFSGSMKIFST